MASRVLFNTFDLYGLAATERGPDCQLESVSSRGSPATLCSHSDARESQQSHSEGKPTSVINPVYSYYMLHSRACVPLGTATNSSRSRTPMCCDRLSGAETTTVVVRAAQSAVPIAFGESMSVE